MFTLGENTGGLSSGKAFSHPMNVAHLADCEPRNATQDIDLVAGFVTSGKVEGLDEFCSHLSAGMRTFYPQFSWKLVHATPHCSNSTRSQVQTSGVNNLVVVPAGRFGVHRVTFPAHGVPTKTNGFRAILQYAQSARAKVTLLLDPSQRGFDCTWVDALVRPSLHSKYDLVAPAHSGSARERLLSSNLISPMFQSLFGIKLMEPMGGELAISARLATHLLRRRDWDSPAARFAPELWMSFLACVERFRVAETVIGESRRVPAEVRLDFQASFAQILNALFVLMEQYEHRWSSNVQNIEFDRFGVRSTTARHEDVPDGIDHVASFVEAFTVLCNYWRTILDPRTFTELASYRGSLLSGDPDSEFGNALWVRLVYEFAAAWKRRVLPRPQLIGLFTPLYVARAGSFLLKTRWKEISEVDTDASRVGLYFEAIKPVLDRLWGTQPSTRAFDMAEQVLNMEAKCLKP